ncbi:MAG: type II secretion system F family protein [Candidatus Accumulibacter phosphatis]|uniref:Type II secretion system F family protein n=2 Tax=Candidatus Accumulibacter TaxID=327159 RepID=A0A7D5NBA0_9PROT|nr:MULTISPECIES: type II secretion system F family protein [Candidatus Accumulibacter]QLH49533.1 MAG: type II secretion system F family protein [Candidatus Accumulibacter cognatus]MBL8400814.1 type II secretion system F family protein [Accumulibacter sp.]MBN8516931.1 type II secretion system F family protein [Accumulibacter sp.]MBO3712315.1 type II secretion system F family protein [Accumulibacter sp.]MCC2867520.1 type II secretion system F family protein [Candidatus Accumulibacter phosphatis]
MPLYTYKAVSPEGRMVLGKIDAINLVDLEMRLRRMELDLVNGEPVSNRSLLDRGRVPRRELIHFCFHLQQLVRAGVPILDGLTDLRDSLEHPRFREVVASLIESIEGGQTLSQGMDSHPRVFNKVFVSLIRAGEATGRLPEVLQSLDESLKWEDELAAQTKRIIAYPAFVAMTVLAATFFLMVYLVPQLKIFVKSMGHVLPLQTQILFFISDLMVAYWYLLLLLLALIGVGLRILLYSNPLARFRFDVLKLGLPLFGDIQRKIVLSRFANTFALLYASGIPILESIRTTQDIVGNLVIRQGLERVEQLIGEGQNVTAAFRSIGFFPPLVIRMLRVGESTGALDAALLNVSYFYNRDVRESVQKLQQVIEPLLTLVMGSLLGWIMLSVLGPVYDVISKLKA